VAPIAVQLYTLRREAERNLPAVLERIADIGFLGVESAGLHGLSVKEFRRCIDASGLELTSAVYFDTPLTAEPLGSDPQRFLAQQEELSNSVVVGGMTQEAFTSLGAVQAARRVNDAAELARERGMTFCYHNHWWEAAIGPDGGDPMSEFVENLHPDVGLEVDIYWLQTGRPNAAETLSELGTRVRQLHVKDGPCTPTDPMTAVGSGMVDVIGLLAAAPHVKWHIVELDECASDMFEAVEASYRYLIEQGLSEGRRG
jgi:sugar phosphate isomerase/epimerase